MKIRAPHPDARVGLEGVDLADHRLYADGDIDLVWQTLRHEQPVHWSPRPDGRGFWSVTRHADVRRVLSDHETFSSELGTVVWAIGNPDAAGGKMMAVTDPPRHAELRAPLDALLARQMMQANEGWVRSFVERITRDVWDGEVWDLANAFLRLPVANIASMMGLPDTDVEDLLRWTYAAIAPKDPHFRRGSMDGTLLWTHHEILNYFGEQVSQRRRRPSSDLISHLLAIRVDGRRLTDDEVVVNCYSVALGAGVTTSQAVIATVLALAEQGVTTDPAQMRTTTAVEEALRWASPTVHFMRHAQRDVVLHDMLIRAGEPVVAWITAGNRDETVFERPYVFDFTRRPNPHIAFGHGVHRCVGHHLARATLRVVLDAFIALIGGVELVGAPAHLVSCAAAGIVSMPVRLRTRQSTAATVKAVG